MVHAPIGSESIPVRVSKVDGEIDSLFNTLTSSIFGGSNDDIEDGDDFGEDFDVNSEEEDRPLGATNEDTFLENVGVPRNSDSGPHILSEEESTSNSRKQVKDKTNYLHYSAVHLIILSLGKLIQKLLLNQKCMGYLARAYYSISSTKYYKDDSCWSADLKSNTTEDVISI
ncbi:hypothetical protein Tco_0844760 [Tanacetum coccineum]